MFTIFGRYRGTVEEIDTADTLENARYLVNEYRMAYGIIWSIWHQQTKKVRPMGDDIHPCDLPARGV